MVWIIARKEILTNIITLRFTTGSAVFLSLVILFTSILIKDYEVKLKEYNEQVSTNNREFRQLMTYQNLKPTVYKQPEVLSIFCKGVEDNIGNSARVSIGDVPVMKSSVVGAGNPLLSIFPTFDIVLIFKIVMSLFVLLLAYDAVSGEKEDKTLGMMLSNSVPRHQILLGKFAGGMITVSIPVIMGFVIMGLLLNISPIVSLGASGWIRIGMLFFVSLIMIGGLYSLGLFVSATTKQTSDALIILLFLWVFFIIVVPNMGAYIATQLVDIESRENIDDKIRESRREYNKEYNEFQRKAPQFHGHMTQSDKMELWGWYHEYATKNLIQQKNYYNKFREPLRIKYAEKAWQIEQSYIESLKKQKKYSDILSRFSPISIYEIIMSKISGTETESYESFFKKSREYRAQLIQYLYNIDAFSLTRYTCTVEDEYLRDFKGEMNYSEMRDEYLKRKVSPIDIDNIPKFHYKQESFTEALNGIIIETAILILIGIIFFLLAFTVFLRYDVR